MKHEIHRYIALAAALALAIPAQAGTRFVATTGSDSGDCTVEANPCATISYAIGEADPADTIVIADGEYTELITIDKSLSVLGESEQGTIIQAHEFPGQAAGRVITIDAGLVVDITGLTIRHGVAAGTFPDNAGGGIFSGNDAVPTLTDVTFDRNNAGVGGGMFNGSSSTPTLINVTFNANLAISNSGGGMYAADGSSSKLIGVTFSGNTAGTNGGGMYKHSQGAATLTDVIFHSNVAVGSGGGMYAPFSTALTNVTFSDNRAGTKGGGMYSRGGAMLTNVTFSGNLALGEEEDQGGGGMYEVGNGAASPTLTDVTFAGNAAVRGGGMRINDGSISGDATLRNVVFRDNTASAWGGGMYVRESSPALTNVVFTGNEATANGGGGMFNFSNSSPELTNVSFAGNASGEGGGGMRNAGRSDPALINAIFWNNQADGSTTSPAASMANFTLSAPVISYSLVANSGGSGSWDTAIGIDGGSNLDADPLFADAGNGDLRLQQGSPAIDAGDPVTDPLIFPTDNWGDPIDLLGNPRFFGTAVDMGAYEFQPPDEVFRDRFEQ